MAFSAPAPADEFIRQQWRMWIETIWTFHSARTAPKFIRQQWRMWIETTRTWKPLILRQTNSFASNGECGLKHRGRNQVSEAIEKFIRQQWRMWIETG